MTLFVQQYISELFSALALILSAAANWRSARTNRESKAVKKNTRRMDMLIEIERKNSVVGKLTLVTAQKILLLQQHDSLVPSPSKEIERLRGNLEMLQHFRENAQGESHIAESACEGDSVELHLKALTDIRRLRVSMEADVEKEIATYNELLEKVRTLNV
ncbi:MAG: hypothetical protein P8P12_11335 [Porticoccaceae bacterium]|jgi:hypothetical protein|nr:hypothetical protein [Porticoccaceae bacterium]